MLPEAAGRGQHLQVRGHSFSLYGPTLSRQITYLFFSSDKLAYNWVYTTFLSVQSISTFGNVLFRRRKQTIIQPEREFGVT